MSLTALTVKMIAGMIVKACFDAGYNVSAAAAEKAAKAVKRQAGIRGAEAMSWAEHINLAVTSLTGDISDPVGAQAYDTRLAYLQAKRNPTRAERAELADISSTQGWSSK